MQPRSDSSRSVPTEPFFTPTEDFIPFTTEEILQSIPERFQKIVRQYPDRLAIKVADRELTYDALNQAANRIAQAILGKQPKGSESIALLFEHGIKVIAAILGVLKAGKFYVAIDPSFPMERNAFVLNDSQSAMIVTDSRHLELAEKLTDNHRTLLNIDEINDSSSSDNLDLLVAPTNLAAIMYTSGSAGKPKGVAETHGHCLENALLNSRAMGIRSGDRLTLLHSVSFSAAKVTLHTSLLNGAALFPFDIKSEGIQRLARWLTTQQITVIHCPPTVFRELADPLVVTAGIPGLRLIRLSGTPITHTDFELYKKIFPPTTFLEVGMGSTETGQIFSAAIDHSFSFPKEGSPIGYPYEGRQILLLDEDGHEVELGAVGEIAVKGRYLTAGYWRNPELTRAKFLAAPSADAEQIYLTGDLGRILPDGFFIHLGRKDFLVKIRGYRVELGEVERRLLEHPEVKDAGVAAWDREDGEKYLAAYVVPCNQPTPVVDGLRSFLREKLPEYMIPSAFMFLDSLPLTNGKLD